MRVLWLAAAVEFSRQWLLWFLFFVAIGGSTGMQDVPLSQFALFWLLPFYYVGYYHSNSLLIVAFFRSLICLCLLLDSCSVYDFYTQLIT